MQVTRADEKKPAAKDEAKLLGTWIPQFIEKGGEPAPTRALKTFLLTFKEGGHRAMGKDQPGKGTYKVDADKKPKQIELSFEDGVTFKGIYELEGNVLKLCLDERKGGRPTEFKSTKNSSIVLIVLQRDED